jgi:hypothetical protein
MYAVIDGRQETDLVVPAGPGDLAAHYDLTISHPPVEMVQFSTFERWLAEAAAAHGLSCALIHEGVVGEALARLGSGKLTVGFHLDYESYYHRPDDPFARFAFAVLDAGGRPVNLPARARAFTDKASAHHDLFRHGLGVPPTVLVRPWQHDRELTEEEAWHLRLDEPGTRLYVKPANGSCSRGVRHVDRPTPARVRAAVAEARRFDPDDAYLVQTEIRPPWLTCDDGTCRPAYWRVLSCLGETTAFWWQPVDQLRPGQYSYREVTPQEVLRHRLRPIFDYADEVGALTGLEWFSTELTLCPFALPGRLTVSDVDGLDLTVTAIDYVNDQCDVDVQGRWVGGLPDDYVRRLAWRFAERAWQVRRGSGFRTERDSAIPLVGVIRRQAS